jgi:signal transduction histidine kinase
MYERLAAPSWTSRALNILAVVVIGYAVVDGSDRMTAPWLFVASGLALAAWFANQFVTRRLVSDVLLTIMALGGALATVQSDSVLISAVIVAILVSVGSPKRPLALGVALWLASAVIISVTATIENFPALALLSTLAGTLIALLAGFARRQLQASEAQSRLLLEERAAAAESEVRGAALAERQSMARDLHDVLAHSLGGLVIQLDAVDALLESGRIDDAHARVVQARALAASGLDDARKAVGVLREPAPVDTDAALKSLIETHRQLGGTIGFTVDGSPSPLSTEQSEALVRTLQESLTNARKHAPGAPVTVSLDWHPDAVTLVITNPDDGRQEANADELGSDGLGGHGLAGMAERFSALPGSTVTAGTRDGSFVVAATLVIA